MEDTSTVPRKDCDSEIVTEAPHHVEVTQPKAPSSGDLERDDEERRDLPQRDKRTVCLDSLQFICCFPCIGLGWCILKCGHGGMC